MKNFNSLKREYRINSPCQHWNGPHSSDDTLLTNDRFIVLDSLQLEILTQPRKYYQNLTCSPNTEKVVFLASDCSTNAPFVAKEDLSVKKQSRLDAFCRFWMKYVTTHKAVNLTTDDWIKMYPQCRYTFPGKKQNKTEQTHSDLKSNLFFTKCLCMQSNNNQKLKKHNRKQLCKYSILLLE